MRSHKIYWFDIWQMTIDIRNVTFDIWHMTFEIWHLTYDIWNMTFWIQHLKYEIWHLYLLISYPFDIWQSHCHWWILRICYQSEFALLPNDVDLRDACAHLIIILTCSEIMIIIETYSIIIIIIIILESSFNRLS